MQKIIQIVPSLPPAIDGVGDYALQLALQLRSGHDLHTVFVVCNPDWQLAGGEMKGKSRASEFTICQLQERSAAELSRVLSQPGMPATAVLQYVGYGYEKRGCPLWLLQGLRQWQKPGHCLLTMFHELFAFGAPWGSAFWTSPVQRWLAKSLAGLSRHCFTNMSSRADILRKYTSRNESDFTILPVFSNIGEPGSLPAWNRRQPRLVVFGSDGSRRKTYREHKSSLEAACRSLGLKEIVDVGRNIDIPPLAVPVIRRGVLSAAEAGREMLNARAGFFNHDADCLGKSGVYAAYATHGLAPVTFDENRKENRDGLLPGVHFIFARTAQMGNAEKAGIMARAWYAAHSQPRQAEQFSKIIKQSTGGDAAGGGTVQRGFEKDHAAA